MNKQLLKDSLLWGFLLWLFGYVLGFVFFPIFPTSVIGWYIMPFGIAATLFVLWKFVKVSGMRDFVLLGISWALIAVILDYLLLVQVLHPADGYYKLDVYLYYFLAFALPVAFGYWKSRKEK